MKNVVFILVDCLMNDALNQFENSSYVMPFLNKLKSNGCYMKALYGQAPYTEGAIKGILCGINTLDEGGYIHNLQNNKTINELYTENGYNVYSTIYHYCNTNSFMKGVNERRYGDVPKIQNIWGIRLKYYRELYISKQLDNKDTRDLIEIMDDFFEYTLLFYKDMIQGNDSGNLFKINLDKMLLEEIHGKLSIEEQKYRRNKVKYINRLLEMGEEHLLFKVPEIYTFDEYREKEKLKNMVEKKLIHKLLYKQLATSIKHKGGINSLYKVNKQRNKETVLIARDYFNQILQFIRNYYDIWIVQYFLKQKSLNLYKTSFCAKRHFEDLIEWIKENRKQPYYAFVHLDDLHGLPMFYSYGIDDEDIVKEEVKCFGEALKKAPIKNDGNILYNSALRHIDNQIKMFYEKLEEDELLDNTIIVITGDHGPSLNTKAIRDEVGLNYYSEKYHVPFIVVGQGVKSEEIDRCYLAKDIIPTLIHICRIKYDKCFKGRNMLDSHTGRDIVVQEFLGGGCPDIRRKYIYMCAFNQSYKLTYLIKLKQAFEEGILYEVYDLQKDKNEITNLVNRRYDKNQVEVLLNAVKQRFEEIQKMYAE